MISAKSGSPPPPSLEPELPETEIVNLGSPPPEPEPESSAPVIQFRLKTSILLGESEFLFCPRCHNLLSLGQADEDASSSNRYTCILCPYYIEVTRKYVHTIAVEKGKKDEDEEGIVDLEKQNERRQKTQVICPNCSRTEAYFYQMQTRSADEPMTNFYECTNKDCRQSWRD